MNYGYPGYPQRPPPKPFPVWAILLIVFGSLAAVVAIGVGVIVLRADDAPAEPSPRVRTAVASPAAVSVHVTVPATTSAGRETQLWIGVRNDGKTPVGRCRISLSMSGVDVSWTSAQTDINLLGLFDSARSFDFPESIPAGDARIFKLAFVPASAGRLTVSVSASHETENGTDAPCLDVREQKQAIFVEP